MVIQPPGFQLPDDLEYPRPVPGLGSTMDPVEITGGFVADFYGISYKVHKTLKKTHFLRRWYHLANFCCHIKTSESIN